MKTTPFLSICIPSYNRPSELRRLLESVDSNFSEIEVVICEDRSPKRTEIIKEVEEFSSISKLACKLHLNEINLGYDENLKNLISKANGTFVMYMGDDDKFQKGQLAQYIQFLKDNPQLGYILRRYSIVHENGSAEDFRYYNSSKFFEPSSNTFAELFRKSVFISGFCFRRELVLDYFNTSRFKGTLLYQLFICGRLTLEHPSAYCDIPITVMAENERGTPEFGKSENESKIYTPGSISAQNSINFMKSFLTVTNYFDETYKFNATKLFLVDLSKYSYPVLAIQRPNGLKTYLEYNKKLREEVGINQTVHYYIYYYSLLLLGKKSCDKVISFLKKIIGKTPKI